MSKTADEIMTPRPADAWEKRRREDRKIRDVRYGFFRIGTPVEPRFCSLCSKEIVKNPNTVVINGVWMHGDCFVSANRQNNS